MKSGKAAGIQYAALPYRITGQGVEILLITSRDTRRWVIPKGWPIPGLSPSEGAATEAAEEAGVFGEIENRPVGSYRYLKKVKGGREIPVQVTVFAFRVEGQETVFKEQGQRDFAWLPYRKAATRVAEASLSRLMREVGKARAPSLIARLQRGGLPWRFSPTWNA